MRKIVFLLILLICTIRIVNYAIYTIRDKNKIGGVGLFALSLLTIIFSAGIFVK